MIIIYAENDMIKEEHLQRLAELIPNSNIHKIARCNHFTILNKKETIGTILKYLTE